MKNPPPPVFLNLTSAFSAFIAATFLLSLPSIADALGTGSTIAVASSGNPSVNPTVCGIVSHQATQSIVCYRRGSQDPLVTLLPNVSFTSISGGQGFICGVRSSGYALLCWNTISLVPKRIYLNASTLLLNVSVGDNQICATTTDSGTVRCDGGNRFAAITSGFGFSCGIVVNGSVIRCWGSALIARGIESEFGNMTMLSVQAGVAHVCGVNSTGFVVCRGDNSAAILLGPDFNISTTSPPPFSPSPPPSSSGPSKALTKGLLAFAIIGSVGIVSGICTVIYCIWTGPCFGRKKIHNSVQPTITRAGSNGGGTNSNNNSGFLTKSSTIRRQSSKAMRRQRSGTSSKAADRTAEEFTFLELASATNGFSPDNKIGAGSYGVVYRGKLSDGREVAIKRGETNKKAKKYQEKESAFESELSFLSRLHHKHLVRLVGYCEDGEDEKLLVYEYMKNGALYDHLHNSDEKSSGGVMNSWKMRIKVALDAARGIDYLHNYAVPPIIHRDIKSSNILLDENWVARVSDFGLSLLGHDPEREFRPTKAAGTVGYIDPEYYSLNVLTAKSDVYGLGVVLMELLTGKRAIFKGEDGTPTSIVEYAAAKIAAGELWGILDGRVGAPDVNVAEAVELVGYTAMHCVSVEGKDRPTMSDIVVNLERALVLCDGSHGSISSGGISIVSV
ncbi:Putative serine/threonine-protein kinase-like protein CCR3 [Linum perenne]